MTTTPALSDLEWESCFDRRTLARGIEYANGNRVSDLQQLDILGLRWSAAVRGSRARAYRCEAKLTPPKGRAKPRLVSQCTCPMSSRCKHVVAMLCVADWSSSEADDDNADTRAPAHVSKPPAPVISSRAIRTPAASAQTVPVTPDPLAEWLPWLQPVSPPVRTTPADAPNQFGLLLRGATYGAPPQLLVAMVGFRVGKQGQPVDPKSLLLLNGSPDHAPVGGWSDDELMALGVLLERQVERIGKVSYAPLRGSIQERAFEVLLQRQPLYFERAAQALAIGPARQLALHWQDQPDGSQRLVCNAADGRALQLFKAESVWYVDSAARQFGRIEAGLPLLELARRAPPLLPEHSRALRQRLQDSDSPVPQPAERPPPRRLIAQPTLSLQLRTFLPGSAYWERGKHPVSPAVGVAWPGFDYTGLHIAPDDPDRLRQWRDGELIEIQRDRKAEQACLGRLDGYALRSPRQLPYPLSYSFIDLPADCRLLAPDKSQQPQAPEVWADTLRKLAADGMQLNYDADFPRPMRDIEAGDWDAELSESGNAWFDLSLGIDIEGERVDLLPILRQILADPAFPLLASTKEPASARWRVQIDEQRALLLPLAKLRALIAPLLDWLHQEGPLRLHRSQTLAIAQLPGALHWRGDARLRERMLALGQRPVAAKAPAGFKATLRPYQRNGLAWLNFLGEAGLGGVLADDMGLGKTVQVLAHLLAERRRSEGQHRTLVVAPTSLMGNWQSEAARFAPALKTLLLHGPDRADQFAEIAGHDLILTTYPLLPRDREHLLKHDFSLLVLDEAQAIKNAKSQASQVVRELHASRRLAMTGTPLENHLGELWAQFDAIEPGLLGSERDFTRIYRTPIEKHGDDDRRHRLSRRIGPLLLRRRKDEVLTDLPAKTEIVRRLDLEAGQRELYETLRLAQHQRVREAVSKRGLAQSGIIVLDALLKLRQVCCDPRLVKLPAARKVKESAKLDALLELLTTLLEEGRKILLFSQFTGMLDLIESVLARRKIPHMRLDGDTPGRARAGIVQRFQNGETPLFLISLKAGGVGLNLTAADTVIHYDPWWNPAVENQATDRAHRIGQDKPVFVYKLICQGTVEEKILALQTRKAALAQAVLEGGRSMQLRFTEKDLAELFAPMR